MGDVMERRTVLKLPALALLLDPLPPGALLAFGDSITAGLGGAHPYAPQVAARLGYTLDNRAVSGTRAAEHVAAIEAATFAPHDRALWLSGYNDMRAGTALDAYADALRAGLAACPVPLLLGNCLRMQDYGTVPGWDAGSDARVDAMNAVIAEVVTGFPLVTLIDACAAFDPMNTDDGVHPNDAGHAQLAQAFAPWRVWAPMG